MLDQQKKLQLTHFPTEIQRARRHLQADIKKWQSHQQEVMPLVTDLVADLEDVQPDNKTLYLPSDIPLDQHIAYGLCQLAAEELQLHEGEAYDALESIQQAVKYAVCLHGNKDKHATGQSMNLHDEDIVQDAEEKQPMCIVKYQHAWRAMITVTSKIDSMFCTFSLIAN